MASEAAACYAVACYHDGLFDHGRIARVDGKRVQLRQSILIDAGVGGDLVIDFADQGGQRGLEGAGGGVSGEVNGDDYGDTEADGKDREQSSGEIAAERPEDEAAKDDGEIQAAAPRARFGT